MYESMDTNAIETIRELLNGREWNADTCDSIAQIIRDTGREVADITTDAIELKTIAAYALRDAAVAMATYWDAIYDIENALDVTIDACDMVTDEAGMIDVPASTPEDYQHFMDVIDAVVDEALAEKLEDEFRDDAEPIDWSEPE
jgi:hypothetical protein